MKELARSSRLGTQLARSCNERRRMSPDRDDSASIHTALPPLAGCCGYSEGAPSKPTEGDAPCTGFRSRPPARLRSASASRLDLPWGPLRLRACSSRVNPQRFTRADTSRTGSSASSAGRLTAESTSSRSAGTARGHQARLVPQAPLDQRDLRVQRDSSGHQDPQGLPDPRDQASTRSTTWKA